VAGTSLARTSTGTTAHKNPGSKVPKIGSRSRLRINRNIQAGVGSIPVPNPTVASAAATAEPLISTIDDDPVCIIHEVVNRAGTRNNRDSPASSKKSAKPAGIARARPEPSRPSAPVQNGGGRDGVAHAQMSEHVELGEEEEMSLGDSKQLISSLGLITQEETRSEI
jgi:hypothetical protein